jgi:hypothetical protein
LLEAELHTCTMFEAMQHCMPCVHAHILCKQTAPISCHHIVSRASTASISCLLTLISR